VAPWKFVELVIIYNNPSKCENGEYEYWSKKGHSFGGRILERFGTKQKSKGRCYSPKGKGKMSHQL
jgi:hypothetical protein